MLRSVSEALVDITFAPEATEDIDRFIFLAEKVHRCVDYVIRPGHAVDLLPWCSYHEMVC
jgi:hypothetical protein